MCYIPSLKRGHKVLKQVGKDLGLSIDSYGEQMNYDDFYKDLIAFGLVFDIEDTDGEVLWKFKDKDLDVMAKYMNPVTSGAGISPFSSRNLPKKKYVIPNDQISVYKDIINFKDLDDKLVIGRITSHFISDIIPKKHSHFAKTDMKALMKEKMLKGKEFIHSIGFWDEYMDFLRKKLRQ